MKEMRSLYVLTIFLLLFTGCKPSDFKLSSPTSSMSGGAKVNFNHNMFLGASCIQCHENKRPKASPPHGNGADCLTCHTAALNSSGVRSWLNVTNFNHSPMPVSCISCHESKRPRNISPHSTGQLGEKQDCVSCHSFPNWKPASFNHVVPLTSCIECHRTNTKDDRPLPKASHPSAVYNQIDCIQCHTNSNNSKKWADVIFNHRTHTPAPTSCMNCHEIIRPLSHTLSPRISGMDKADCKSCHTSSADWKQVAAFDHENMKPTSCIGCHSTSTPANQTGHPSIIGNYNKIDCFQCHTYDKSTSARSWSKITFNYSSHSPTPTSCLECHKNVNNSMPISGTHLSGSRSSNDCATCHKFDSIKLWTNFSGFNHIVIGTGERCDSCHNSSTKTLKSKPTTHIVTTLDCKSCHSSSAWKPASFAHSSGDTNCISCHNGTNATGRPVGHNLSLSNHQCSSCHSQASFTAVAFDTNYKHSATGALPPKGTSYHKSQSSCTTCHSSTSDNVSFSNSTLTPKCAGCHTSNYVPSKHSNKTISTNANCLSCHSYSGF